MARAICDRCHQIIEPLYRSKAAKKFAKTPEVVVEPIAAELQATEYGQLYDKLMPILTTLGIGFDDFINDFYSRCLLECKNIWSVRIDYKLKLWSIPVLLATTSSIEVISTGSSYSLIYQI